MLIPTNEETADGCVITATHMSSYQVVIEYLTTTSKKGSRDPSLRPLTDGV